MGPVYFICVAMILLSSLICSQKATMIYHQPAFPAFFPTNRYVAVPGRVIQHIPKVPVYTFQNVPMVLHSYHHEYEDVRSAHFQHSKSPSLAPISYPRYLHPIPQPRPAIVHKHISIHTPPEEMELDSPSKTVIRPKLPEPEKHVNIIFIKAPNPPKAEIILPEAPQQKTLIYILVKKQEQKTPGFVSIRRPSPTKPPKPEVFYIRYKEHMRENISNTVPVYIK